MKEGLRVTRETGSPRGYRSRRTASTLCVPVRSRSVAQRAAVLALLGGARVHARRGIAPDRLVAAVCPRALGLEVVTAALELLEHAGRQPVLDVEDAPVRHHGSGGLARSGV